ncbi:SUN domain-containing protein [Mycena sanguinolenta]|uniref:SUN domain-containing protein n=1 Tax=Mycena sanguinolenta TaxID=230812 RepID=A0A8H7DHG0_9AGAR|nr:SUN domain-containing protein [Mycena sanguinolenta]
MFFLLPPALVALILASPALAVPQSFNDPFKALAAHVVKLPEPPVCCLKPLEPTEPVQDDVLLSFEEWKEKQLAIQTVVVEKAKEKEGTVGERAVDGAEAPTPAAEVPNTQTTAQDAPHFRVPITDRFNYASLDCSARVHTSHRSAKSPASILSSKRDRYMLSPCRAEQQFIVVELCEDIRIDTVQLANFEFFSGVFKDFTVSVSKTYTTDPEGWTFASTHTAKNIRVSFHPPTSLRDFYRYIRIDFHSHYSNEYYCPISLLRVYGLTHLEEYKWEIWEQESRARAQQAVPSLPTEEPEPEPAPVPNPVRIPASYAEFLDAASTDSEEPLTGAEQPSQNAWDADTGFDEVLPPPATSEPSEPIDTSSTTSTTSEATSTDGSSTTQESGAASDSAPPSAASAPSNDAPAANGIPSTTASTTASTVSASNGNTGSALSTTSLVPAPAGGESIYRIIMNRLTALEANHTLYARYVEEHTSAVREMLRRVGEDLGRAEGVGKAQAQTYARTLLEWEKQRKRVDADFHELMRRIEYLSDEIVLEKRLGIAQLLLLLAVLVFMTLTRGSRGEAVMVPSVSRSALRAWGRRNLSLRNLSGSGDWDWVARLRSRSRSPKPAAPKPKEPQSTPIDARADTPIKLEFPSTEEKPPVPPSTASRPKPPRLNLNLHGPARPRSRTRSIGNTAVLEGQRAHSRTPTLGRTPHRRPETPTRAHAHTPAVLPIMHSVSHGSHAPRSARRWARTAHLHELRGGASGSGTASAQRLSVTTTATRDSVAAAPRSAPGPAAGMSAPDLGEGTDVFASPSPMPSGARSAGLRGMGLDEDGGGGLLSQDPSASPPFDLARGAYDGDADAWVDTDGSEVDGDADVGLESPWMERADHVAVGA